MHATQTIFWICLSVAFYAYVGYPIVLCVMVLIKRTIRTEGASAAANYEPEVTLLIAAYNEKDYVEEKMRNTQELDYLPDKLKVIWITDGSTDGTPDLLKRYPKVIVLHQDTRAGKIGAINRGMRHVSTPITVFCDANAQLEKYSIRRMVGLFANPKVGCVSGEKRILLDDMEAAAASGEGIYWRYESTLKRWDSELNSVVGAAGELFAIRTDLFEEVEPDTLLDDFMISMRIAQRGYKVKYNHRAYAVERASSNITEELKRKIRISAGGIQCVVRLAPLLNIFKYGLLSFQYVSHRVLRWTLAPLCLLLVLFLNFAISIKDGFALSSVYTWFFAVQVVFYLLVVFGFLLRNRKLRARWIFIPFFFYVMNYSVFRGFIRYIKGSQSINWDRVERA